MLYYLLLLLVINFDVYYTTKNDICEADDIADTNIEDQTYLNSEPSSLESSKIEILQKVNVKSDNECVKICCNSDKCDAVSIVRNLCVLFHCRTLGACIPHRISSLSSKIKYMVLTPLKNVTKERKIEKKDFDEDSQTCELSVPDNCASNEMCKSVHEYRRTGICVCISGFVKSQSGCVEELPEHGRSRADDISTSPSSTKSNSSPLNDRHSKRPSTTLRTTIRSQSATKKTTKIPVPNTITPITKANVFGLVAHAGPDLHLSLANPQGFSDPEIVSIHGYAANRKGKIVTEGVTYQWKRDSTSLSVGSVLNGSDHKSTLMLINLLHGQYVFVLTITDKNGVQSSDSVTIVATERPDQLSNNMVEVLLETDVYKFTEQESINFSRRMGHVIEKNLPFIDVQVHVKSVYAGKENKTMITFYAETVSQSTKEVIPAGVLEEKLKMKLIRHKFIFDYPISKFQSRVCFNLCGGHGSCCQYSHRCDCNLPWLNNPWHERSTGFSNCDMHVMIIVVMCVAVIFISVLLFLSLRTFARICRKRRLFRKDVLRYKLIDNTES